MTLLQSNIRRTKRILSFSATIFLVLFMTLSSSPRLYANEIYRWTDNNGKNHFSDQKPTDKKIAIYSPTEIQKINFIPTPKIRFVSKSGSIKKRRTSKKTSISYCTKIKQNINDIEQNLRKKLLAQNYDKLNQKLQDLRWQKIKKC